MTSRATSFSSRHQTPQLSRRPSATPRHSFIAASHGGEAEAQGQSSSGPGYRIEEEIAEIKRYEDFSTIDWVQDAAREHARRKARRKRTAGIRGQSSWRYRLAEYYDAAQAWIVVTLIGGAIGLIASFLNIVTEWLSDIKVGHCSTAFYLNKKFCCWGEDSGCDDWHPWTGFGPVNYIAYIIFASTFAFVSATLVKSFAPYAAGSGISEIKCIIAGFVMKGFLGFWTLLIKSLALPLAIASGLSVGKEGPSVHYAVCTGNVIARMFAKYRRNASRMREILSACAAAGVAVAFGSPIGGVLFSLEEMSNYFPLKTMWRSYFCALVATAVLAAINPFRTGALVIFEVRYDRSWHFFEILFYIIIGVFGALYGAFIIKWNLRAQQFRKQYLGQFAVLEAVMLAAGTAIVCYPNAFLRIDMTESMEILFLECEGGEDYHGLCNRDRRLSNILSLIIATALRMFLVIISYGCKVPAGIFVPSMAIGAAFGRTVGILVQALHEASPADSVFFSACKPDEPCITPGTYAFLGAAAALSGIMHLTVSVVVIMFELTGALTYILPTMIVVGVTKVVSSILGGRGGIADRMIWFNGFPFLDNKEEHNFGVPVSQVMRNTVVSLPVTGMALSDVELLLADDKYQGFPVVHDTATKVLVGYIGSTEMRYALERARRERALSPSARCNFAPPPTTSSGASTVAGTSLPSIMVTAGGTASDTGRPPHLPNTAAADTIMPPATSVDLGRYVDAVPVTVHPSLPLETVLELFRKIGPRVVLVEYHGRLAGLVTVKDCLRYQFKVEAAESGGGGGHGDTGHGRGERMLWDALVGAAAWVSEHVAALTSGRVQLRRGVGAADHVPLARRHAREGSETEVGLLQRSPGGRDGRGILDGDEEEEFERGVELENRS